MKMLIDLPEKADYDQILMALNGGLRLPDNATNGDMIKVMFPFADIEIGGRIVAVDINVWITTFPLDWWNAPYEKGE